MLVPAIELHFLSQLLDLKIERLEFIFFGNFRLCCQDVWSSHSASGPVPAGVLEHSSSLTNCRAVAFACPSLTCFPSVWLWLFFPFWPLAESYCTSEASARTLTSPWFWLPVGAGLCVRTVGMWSGLARGRQRRLLGSWTSPSARGKCFSWRTG